MGEKKPNRPSKCTKKYQPFLIQEEPIKAEEKEDLRVKGCIDLSKYHKKKRKKSKKRCWICLSPHHLKRTCPKIRCFHFGKLGHLKTNCFRKKLDYLFQKVKEKYEIEKQSNKLKKELQKQKKEEREKELEIIKLRANHLEFHLEKSLKEKLFMGNRKILH